MGASTVVKLCESFDERRHNLFHLGWIMEPGGKITVTRKRALKVGDLRVLQLSESSLDPTLRGEEFITANLRNNNYC
jgi:hypothetical protein